MSKAGPPEGGNGDDGKREPPARLTAMLLSKERAASRGFPAHDRDFNGANDEAMAIKLATLEEEHRDLDAAILALEINSPYERLTIARLKKKKLRLKDQIKEIKDSMLPDIIA